MKKTEISPLCKEEDQRSESRSFQTTTGQEVLASAGRQNTKEQQRKQVRQRGDNAVIVCRCLQKIPSKSIKLSLKMTSVTFFIARFTLKSYQQSYSLVTVNVKCEKKRKNLYSLKIIHNYSKIFMIFMVNTIELYWKNLRPIYLCFISCSRMG